MDTRNPKRFLNDIILRQLTGRTQTGWTDSLAARAGLKDELIVLVEDCPVPAPSAMAAPPV